MRINGIPDLLFKTAIYLNFKGYLGEGNFSLFIKTKDTVEGQIKMSFLNTISLTFDNLISKVISLYGKCFW